MRPGHFRPLKSTIGIFMYIFPLFKVSHSDKMEALTHSYLG